MTDSPRLANRVALVTGASRGIGRAVAVGLAREGAHVVLLARTTAGLEEVDDEIRAAAGTATLVTLDLRKPDKVDALGPTLYQRWGKLDILVANAGVLGPISPLPHITADAWNEVIDINLTANWRLIRSLDPLLRRADAARAVFVSSGAASGKNAYWGPYAVSKAGLEALVKTYAHEVASTAIKVNLLNPGPVRTTMRQRAYPGENPDTLPAPEALVPMFLDLLDVGQSDSGQVYNFRQAQ
jgi:NAD(P)-dependent dehydrogenase (short-subunit alcohol dehydrogenase family)